jgi:acyl dehydratase
MTESDELDRDQRLYLDDFHVGQRFTSATHVIDAAQIKAFARQFDPQPFHLDEEAAKGTLFGGLVASGWHTAAVTMRLQVESGLPIAGGIIGIGGEMSWPRPTRPGDVLRSRFSMRSFSSPGAAIKGGSRASGWRAGND